MAEKHLVVNGATCLCNFGSAPDNLVVNTNKQNFANDKSAANKYIASNKDIGTTLKKNTFGSCSKQNNKPCNAVISEWTDFYDKVTLNNGGKIILEDSKATCPVGGPGCIKIIKHGQIAEVNNQSFSKSSPDLSRTLNPAVDMQQLETEPKDLDGIILS